MKQRLKIVVGLVFAALAAQAFDAAEFGFAPEKSGRENLVAFQKALDRGGLVEVTKPGRYKIADRLLIGSDTTVRCAPATKSREGDLSKTDGRFE